MTGNWTKEECDPEDFWNPLAAPHGGECRGWNEVEDQHKKAIKENPKCYKKPCEWGIIEKECSKDYYNIIDGERGDFSCETAGHVFDLPTEGCRPCSKVLKADGVNKCC